VTTVASEATQTIQAVASTTQNVTRAAEASESLVESSSVASEASQITEVTSGAPQTAQLVTSAEEATPALQVVSSADEATQAVQFGSATEESTQAVQTAARATEESAPAFEGASAAEETTPAFEGTSAAEESAPAVAPEATQVEQAAAENAVPAAEATSSVEAENAANTIARGEPYAFGTGVRSARAEALVNQSAQNLGYSDFSALVDRVVYDAQADSPSFWVDPVSGERSITIDAATFGKTQAGQLIVGTHELVHAEQWADVLLQNGGNFSAAHSAMFGASDLDYAIREVITERTALQNVTTALGGLSPQQIAPSTSYIKYWQNAIAALGGTPVP
jgi:hypothetical protein